MRCQTQCTRLVCAAAKLCLYCTVAAVGSPPAAGAIIAQYQAGRGTTVPEPEGRWTAHNASAASGNPVFPVEDDLGTGLNAWQVTDQSRGTSNPAYIANVSASERAQAMSAGWRLTSRARYVFDFDDGPGLGLAVSLAGRSYEVRLDLDGGDLRAMLIDETQRIHHVTTGGTGPLAYHDFALEFDPLTSLTRFRVDGQSLDAWDGVPTLATDAVQWGNGTGTTRGIINYHAVAFEVGPFVTATSGDYDADADVDGHDFLAWMRGFGSSSLLDADGNRDGKVDGADYVLWRAQLGGTSPPTPGDYDADGDADGADFLVWQRAVGSLSSVAGDGNGDGRVDAADLETWRMRFGAVGAVPSMALVPEPSALAVAALGSFWPRRGAAKRRRAG